MQFDESRELLRRAKTALRNHAAEVLKSQVNEALSREYITDANAGLQGIYEWTVNFGTTDGSEADLQLKFGPSASFANEKDDYWEETVSVGQADYSHLFITRRRAIRQSDVTLREVLQGLSPDDFRLRDEIVRFVRDRV